jgi:uncharacterized surface protein with fasciclin (FAS1) repeats
MAPLSPTLRATALAATFLAASTVALPGALAQQRNCVDTLAGMREFSRFTNGIVHSHVAGDIRNANEITIFAPTNDALQRLDRNLIDRLFPMEEGARRADPVLAPAAVGAHIVKGRRDSAALARGGEFRSVAGTPLTVLTQGGALIVRGAGGVEARVTRPDIACSNGVIHAIDRPLIR